MKKVLSILYLLCGYIISSYAVPTVTTVDKTFTYQQAVVNDANSVLCHIGDQSTYSGKMVCGVERGHASWSGWNFTERYIYYLISNSDASSVRFVYSNTEYNVGNYINNQKIITKSSFVGFLHAPSASSVAQQTNVLWYFRSDGTYTNANEGSAQPSNSYKYVYCVLQNESLVTINISSAGALSQLMSESYAASISKLKLTGEMNGNDVQTLHDRSSQNLKYLDLSEVNVVDGGSYKTLIYYRDVDVPTYANNINFGMFSSYTKLETIKLPNSTTSCDQFIFSDNSNLKDVYMGNATPPSFTNRYSSVNNHWGYSVSNVTLHVPNGYKSAYSNTDWRNLGTILDDIPYEEAVNELSIENLSVRKGNQISIPISMKNSKKIVAIQFTLTLPNGITINTEDGDYLVNLTSRMPNHSVTINKRTDGSYGVVAMSMTNKVISGNQGVIMEIPVTCSSSMSVDTYTYRVKDIVLAYIENNVAKEIDQANISASLNVDDYLTGDANNDGKINIVDVVETVNYIVGNASNVFSFNAADANHDGKVNVVDAVAIVNSITTGTPLSSPKRTLAKRIGITNCNSMQETLSADNISITPGESKDITLFLENTASDLTAYQFDLALPAGFEIAKDEDDEFIATISSRHDKSHSLTVNKRVDGDNVYGFACVSLKNKIIKGNDGALVTIKIKATDNVAQGTYQANITNIVFSSTSSVEYDLSNILFKIDNLATGIESINVPNYCDTYYTLDGVKIKEPYKKGIYIKNGKKIIKR